MKLLAVALALPLAVLADQAAQHYGSGHLILLDNSDGRSWVDPSSPRRIGCLDATGKATASDCGVFTRSADSTSLNSTAGVCTFHNSSQPENDNNPEAPASYALSCGGAVADADVDAWYEPGGSSSVFFLCNGNMRCWYDLSSVPQSNDAAEDVWQYLSSAIPAGHTKAQLQWQLQ